MGFVHQNYDLRKRNEPGWEIGLVLSFIFPGEGSPGNSWQVLRVLTQFRPENCHFSHPFSDLASKIHTRFRTWRWSQNATIHVYINRNYVIISEIIKPTKHIHTLRRLPCKPKWAKSVPVFRPKGGQNHTLWRDHTYMDYIHTPPPPPRHIPQISNCLTKS